MAWYIKKTGDNWSGETRIMDSVGAEPDCIRDYIVCTGGMYAEQIMREHNAHQALVDALEGCLQMMALASTKHLITFGTDAAIEALALARGESADPKAVKP